MSNLPRSGSTKESFLAFARFSFGQPFLCQRRQLIQQPALPPSHFRLHAAATSLLPGWTPACRQASSQLLLVSLMGVPRPMPVGKSFLVRLRIERVGVIDVGLGLSAVVRSNLSSGFSPTPAPPNPNNAVSVFSPTMPFTFKSCLRESSGPRNPSTPATCATALRFVPSYPAVSSDSPRAASRILARVAAFCATLV